MQAPATLEGSGTWKLSRSTVKLSIKWKGTTATDSWIPPQISADGNLSGDFMVGDTTFANGKKYKLYGENNVIISIAKNQPLARCPVRRCYCRGAHVSAATMGHLAHQRLILSMAWLWELRAREWRFLATR
jgi:hypothetical protein